MADWLSGIKDNCYSAFIENDRWKLYFEGLGLTLKVSLIAVLIGLLIGTIIAFMKLSVNKKGRPSILSRIAGAYIDIIRGTPSVLQLLIMYFAIFKYSDNALFVASLSFGINSGAYVSEIVRAGILAVDKGQMEAGRALGLSKTQTMISVILPQAFKNVLPPLGNEFIVLIKETAIVGYVGMSDLTRIANQITTRTYDPFTPYIGAAILYFVVVKILSVLLAKLERRLRKSDNR